MEEVSEYEELVPPQINVLKHESKKLSSPSEVLNSNDETENGGTLFPNIDGV